MLAFQLPLPSSEAVITLTVRAFTFIDGTSTHTHAYPPKISPP